VPEISRYLSSVAGSATAQIFSAAKKLEAQGRDVIHFEIGQPDFFPIDKILNATAKFVKEGKVQYTVSKGIPEFRDAISSYYSKYSSSDPECEVTVTAGGKLAIYASVWSVVNPGDNVIILNPSWVSYGDIVLSLGAEPRYITTDIFFNFDEDALRKQIDSHTKAIILNSPSNPTGAIMGRKSIQLLFDIASEYDLLLISDEMYNEYIYGDNEFSSLASVNGWKENGVVINGMSKTFSMTGYRLGYAITNEAISKEINKIMQLTASCAPNFAQHAGVVAFQNIDEMRLRIKKIMHPRRELVVKYLNELSNIEFSEPQGAMYAWFKVNGLQDSIKWGSDLLQETGVAITPGRAFGPAGEGYVRISFATSKELLEEGFSRINTFLST